MNGAAGVVYVAAAHGADRVKECAAIWARAKACRDQDAEPATIEETMPGIWRRLSIDGASLFLARRDGHPVGFLLVAPRARTLEVFYLAVDPDVWGCGVGSRLLLSAEDHAREIGRELSRPEPLRIMGDEAIAGVCDRCPDIDGSPDGRVRTVQLPTSHGQQTRTGKRLFGRNPAAP